MIERFAAKLERMPDRLIHQIVGKRLTFNFICMMPGQLCRFRMIARQLTNERLPAVIFS